MAGKELRSKDDFLNFIEEICKSKRIKMTQLEKETGLSQGLISRWRNDSNPKLINVLNVLQFLDVKILLCTDEPEDNSGVEEVDEDTLLISLLVKILKESTSSDKEKLYKILQVFV